MHDSNKTTPDPEEAAAQRVRKKLLRLRLECLTSQLDLLAEEYPEVVSDAETFVRSTNSMPWEFHVAFADGEIQELKEKYGVLSSRHRPDASEVNPEVDLFYEACELVDQIDRLEHKVSKKG